MKDSLKVPIQPHCNSVIGVGSQAWRNYDIIIIHVWQTLESLHLSHYTSRQKNEAIDSPICQNNSNFWGKARGKLSYMLATIQIEKLIFLLQI